jgi:hypothetical protein
MYGVSDAIELLEERLKLALQNLQAPIWRTDHSDFAGTFSD